MTAEWNKKFKILRLLNESHDMKSMIVEAEAIDDSDGQTKSAVILMEKNPFNFENLTKLLESDGDQFNVEFINDIYHQYLVQARVACNDLKMSIIYPCTSAHIQKYTRKELVMVKETYEDYVNIVRPYLVNNQFNPQWVYNIIDGKSEKERIMLETENFLILPNMSWNGIDVESLYILGLVKSRTISSIRDLTPEHIPMLESMIQKTTDMIFEKYGIPKDRIRSFFHYPPTFYHLHIHFTLLANRQGGCEVERGRLVEDAIDHLRMMPEYYQKKTFYYKLATTDPLFCLLTKTANQNDLDRSS